VDEQKDWWSNELERTFFGNVPIQYAWFTHEHIERVHYAFLKQRGKSVYTVNYVTLIQDIGEGLVPSIKKLKDTFSGIEIKQYQYENKVLFTSLYLKAIQDMDNGTIQSKIDLGHFLRNFIQTATEIYGVEVLENQQAFMTLIDRHEKEQFQKLDEFNQLIALIMKPEEDNLYPTWPHSQEQLSAVSEKLFEHSFTSKPEEFMEAFSKNLQKTSCNWKKNKTAFLFLAGLIYNEHVQLPEAFLISIAERITFKKGRTTTEILKKQFEQIRSKLSAPDNELTKQLLEIKSIHRQVFHSR